MAELKSELTVKIKFDKKLEKAFEKSNRNYKSLMKIIKDLDKRLTKLEKKR